MIQQMLAIWSLVSLPFLNPACTSGSFWFTYCWSLAWRILNITLLACDMSNVLWWFEHSFALPFLGLEWTLTFSSPVATAEISKFAGILRAALSEHHLSHSIIFQDLKLLKFWNSRNSVTSTSFVVMLPEAHLTSHSRVSGSRWVMAHSFIELDKAVVHHTCLTGLYVELYKKMWVMHLGIISLSSLILRTQTILIALSQMCH